MKAILPDLPYAYDALAPMLSVETLEYHHDRHHAAYVEKSNELLAGSKYEGLSLEDVCRAACAAKDADVVNNVGQHWNHCQFWLSMKPGGGGRKLPAPLGKLVDAAGGFDALRSRFVSTAMAQFGTGWAWLALEEGDLKIVNTPDGENPLMRGLHPILACDLWEHAWYVDYRHDKKKYVEAWFDGLANWDHAAAMAALVL